MLTTAPKPVITPQASSAARSNGSSGGIPTAWDASTTTSSANAPVRSPWAIGLSVGIRQRPGLVERERRVAERRLAVRARRARAAGADERHDDVVALGDTLHAGADLDDDPRRLVPEHRRQRASPGALEVVEVALADRAGGEPDPQLAASGRCELHVLDHERFAERAADGGSHRPEDTVEPDRCRTSVRLASALDESGCDLS